MSRTKIINVPAYIQKKIAIIAKRQGCFQWRVLENMVNEYAVNHKIKMAEDITGSLDHPIIARDI